MFFISHRLGFARQADRIILIDGGKVAEEGTHARLMESNGVYHDMFASQQDWGKAARYKLCANRHFLPRGGIRIKGGVAKKGAAHSFHKDCTARFAKRLDFWKIL